MEETRTSEYDTGFKPSPTRSIEVGAGDKWGGDADIQIKSLGDRHCLYKDLDDAFFITLGQFNIKGNKAKVVTHMDQMTEPISYLLVQPGRKEILENKEHSKLTYPHGTIGSEIINSSLLYNIV